MRLENGCISKAHFFSFRLAFGFDFGIFEREQLYAFA